jgi:hypothetical protein
LNYTDSLYTECLNKINLKKWTWLIISKKLKMN